MHYTCICRKSMKITIRPPLDTPAGGTKLACEANWFDADGRSSQMIHPFERDIYIYIHIYIYRRHV